MSDLTTLQQNALASLFDALCPNLALALSEQLNIAVELDTPVVEVIPLQDLLTYSDRVLHTVFSLSQPLPVESLFYISEAKAFLFADLMSGNDGSNPPSLLTDDQSKQLSDAMTGLCRGIAVALTNHSGDTIEMESSATAVGNLSLPPIFAAENEVVQVALRLNIPDITTDTIRFLFTPEFAQALLANSGPAAVTASLEAAGALSEEELAGMLGSLGLSEETLGEPVPVSGSAPKTAAPPFSNFPTQDSAMPRGIDLILDIPLDVTVELGRVQMLIRDVLELSSGSVVELDRVAGEAVDLLVNGRLIAKGEVVVIEDNFGIRITEIISPADRVAGLGKTR